MPKTVPLRELNGRPLSIEVDDGMTVEGLKKAIIGQLQLKDPNVQLIFRSRPLGDSETVSSLQFESDDFIIIHRVLHAPEVIPMPFIPMTNQLATSVTPLDGGAGGLQAKPGTKRPVERTISGHRERPVDFAERVDNILSLIGARVNRDQVIELLERFNFDMEMVVEEVFRQSEVEAVPIAIHTSADKPVPKRAPRHVDVSRLATYNFGQFRGVVDGYDNPTQAALLRCLEAHRDVDPTDLVQIFESCERDPVIVDGCLGH